jgi:type II secretory pathway predicted ATPase ExeA
METVRVDHLQHFGLANEPFGNDPVPGFHFECSAWAATERRVLRGPLHGKGLTVLIGEHGSGKTTVLRRLVDSLPQDRFEAAVMVLVRRDMDARGLLVRVARLFGVTAPPEDRTALIGQLAARLGQIQERGLRAVAVVDEAHLLSDLHVLDELRGLLNLEGEHGRLLSLVLAGLPELERRLAGHAGLGSRVDAKARLEPLDAQTCARYLVERLAVARGKPDLLHPTAISTLHARSGGNPRRLNTLADNALHEAYLAGRGAVVGEDVERAARDLALETAGDADVAVAEIVSAVEIEADAYPEAEPVSS